MKILQTVKYYEPSKGGMESVVKDIVEGVSDCSSTEFTIYANSHLRSHSKQSSQHGKITSIKERTPLLYKSQPLNIYYPSLRRLITDHDIIHHHYPFPNMELALTRNLDLLRRKKLIITWHANIKNSRWSWISGFYDPLIKKLLDVAEFIVVTSPQLLENSIVLQEYKHKVRIIPLSFDPSIRRNLSPKEYPVNRKFNLLFVGKLRKYKGLKYLLDAIKNLNVNLTMIGEGETQDTLFEQARLLNIIDKVEFKSNLSNDELALYYASADLFVLPSINEAEAFGVVQLEAMSNGIPVINTELKSGVPYVSIAGVTGETVKPQSSEELRLAITKLINDPQLFETYSKNALERVKSFSRKRMAESYLNLYSI